MSKAQLKKMKKDMEVETSKVLTNKISLADRSKRATSKTKNLGQPPPAKPSKVSVSSSSSSDEKEADQIGKNVAAAPVVAIDRDEYLQAYKDLVYEKTQQQIKNNLLHRRLAEYYKKRKLEHVLKPLENSQDLEEKYQQKLFAYQDLKEEEEREISDIKSKVQAVEETYASRRENAEKKFDDLQSHEKATATGLIYSKKGKPISDKTVQRFLHLQRRKQEQATALCLRYIRARNAVSELESVVKSLERVGPGLYVAYYEQLCVDNRNYMNKIEEREDELIKNRSKCTEHNQILAHIREKMHHTDEVIDITECDYGDAEIDYQRAREDLGLVKTRRNKLRWSLEAERLRAGLLTKKDLLRDFQDATDLLVKMRNRKEMLQMQILKFNQALRYARTCINNPHPERDEEDDFIW